MQLFEWKSFITKQTVMFHGVRIILKQKIEPVGGQIRKKFLLISTCHRN